MSEQVQPPAYQPGQVVNGHVWTGTEWLPVAAPSRPAQRQAPLSERFHQMSAARRWAIIIGGLVVVGGGWLIVTEVMTQLGL